MGTLFKTGESTCKIPHYLGQLSTKIAVEEVDYSQRTACRAHLCNRMCEGESIEPKEMVRDL